MMRFYKFLPLLLLAVPNLTSCNTSNGKMTISYGTYTHTDLVDIKYSELKVKMEGTQKGENFLLATYYPDSHCSCWSTFQTVLQNYINEYHTLVYKISTGQFSSLTDDYGMTIMHVDTPTLVLIENGKVKKEYIYRTADMFKKSTALREELVKYTNDPNLYYVDQEYLDNAIVNDDKVLVHYVWSFCPDCQYCTPKVLFPYSDAHQFTNKLYILDIGDLTMTDGTFDTFDTSNETYVEFLTSHHINQAGDSTFGYGRGFVPTTQYYENGVLKDMNVYFNDTVELVGDKYVVTESYYTEERVNNLSYLDNVETKVLKGLEISSDDIDDSGSWMKDAASKYHDPILKAFLDKYAK